MAAESYCSACGAVLAEGYRFCGACGHPTGENPAVSEPDEAISMKRIQLVRIQGGGGDGEVYDVSASGTSIGRTDGHIRFPDDFFMSPNHACIRFNDQSAWLVDEDSQNGVFLRIRGEAVVDAGDIFMAGEQLLRVEATSMPAPAIDQDGTQFFGSPASRSTLALRQMLERGIPGLLRQAEQGQLTIGRDGCDIDFPDDHFISGQHCMVAVASSGFVLRDLNSRNGTYLRINGRHELNDGDFIFLGRQLLRVDVGEAGS